MTMIFALTGREPRDLNDLASGDLAWRGHTGPLGNELCELLERAAQYDYRARYKNAREMLAALNESQPTRPVMPPPTPRPAPPVINPPTVQVDPTTIPRPAPPRPAQPEPALPQPASKPQPVPAARRSRLPWLVGLLGVPALGLAVYWASNSTPGTIGPSTPTTTSQQPNALPAGRDFTATVNGVKLEMKNVPAGSFTMGSPANEAERSNDEGPQHRVNVPAFAIGKYEITQAQWQAVTGNNPSNFKGANRPVEQVSWNDVTEFCQKLSQLTGKTYRLPTEAEWEYAARAGTNTPFAFGSLLSSTQANFDGNYPYGGAAKGVYRQQTTDVGSFTANAFGLFDMHGNVWEWCEDVWHDNYNSAPLDGSGWLSGGDSSRRVLRGGSWDNDGRSCRSADRYRYEPGNRGLVIGFRVVLAARTP
ncbi:MAG: formylglycine-generating enzyme family protein [Acidobacteria bacterium]|nr:formylglycine-generating enzyme family protein [Acidobacteriota bacterium]MBI3426541.1 formylglycine-generating enzyme family protein [Acidobacteriota bacterium]